MMKILRKDRIFNILKFSFILIGLFGLNCNGYTQNNPKPNIILILADDLGYGDLGSYGQKMIQTPYLDSLAEEAMRFTDYYAGSAVCAPSRESMLTGRTTGHTSIRGNFLTDQQEDPPMVGTSPTIAELLKESGYATALIGKWGLGGELHGPEKKGFDYSIGYLDQIKAHNYYPDYLYKNGRRIFFPENNDGNKGRNSHDFFVEETLKYIDSVDKDKPFFLYLPYTYPHGGYTVPVNPIYENTDWPNSLKVYASMITSLDRDVKQIINLLEKENIAENTLVIFTSDNGANLVDDRFFGSNGGLRDGKRSLHEGGIRMPFIAYWKGKILPGVTSQMVAAWDLLPTFCDLAGVKPPKQTDGLSFAPTLLGKEQESHESLYWEFYRYNYNWYKPGNELPRNYLDAKAIRYGKWKGIQKDIYNTTSIELYDLSEDIKEQNDVAETHPEIIDKIKNLFLENSTSDAVFFPYDADSIAKLHVFDIYSPKDLKQFFYYSSNRVPIVSSHRGAPALGYPENCLETFRHTLRHTWSIMEIDPHYTKDSAIILMHDNTLDRTSNGTGKISDYTLEEIKGMRLKDAMGNVTKFGIPTLGDALEWAKGKTVLILDQKDLSAEDRAKMIKKHNAQANAMVMCYSFEDAKKVYEMDPDIMMEVFIPTRERGEIFEKTGVPWENVVAFVTHGEPKDPSVFEFLHERGVMAIRGSSRNVDKQYIDGEISKKELVAAYIDLIQSGTDIIEADLGVHAGEAIRPLQQGNKKKGFFTIQ